MFPTDPNAPKPQDPPKYHIKKDDPVGRAAFPQSDFREELW